MTDAALNALFAVDEIARSPADARRYTNRPGGYEARSSIRPPLPRGAGAGQ